MNVSNDSHDLDDKFNIEETILKISNHFIDATSVENAINLAIMEVGNLSKIDNVLVFLCINDKQTCTLRNEWSKTSVELKRNINLKSEEIAWLLKELKNDKTIQINNINKSDKIEFQAKEYFKCLEIQSILAHRLKIDDEIAGFILLCTKEDNHDWKKNDLLITKISSDIISNVLEKHHALEMLSLSEQKYRNIIENIEHGIIILDFDGKFIYASPQYYRIIGSDEGIQKGINFKRIHPEDREKLMTLFLEGAKLKKVLHSRPIEYRILHEKGHYIWVSSSTKDYYDEKGNIIGFISTLRDITKRKTVEQQFKVTEETYHSFIDNFQGIAYQTKNTSSYPFFFRGNITTITGYVAADFYDGRVTWDSLINPEDYLIKKEEIRKLNEIPGYNIDVTYRIHDKQGMLKWVREIVKYIVSGDKKNKFIQGVIYEITDQVLVNEKLKISEGKYKRITENANDLIVVFNQDYEMEYINENVHEKLLGYSPEEVRKQTPLDFIHPQGREKTMEAFVKFFKEGEGSVETRLMHKNGQAIWFHLKGNTFIDIDDKKKILVFARDITAHKKAEKKITESEKKYRLITENANDIICIINDKFKLEYVNEEPCYRIMGYYPEEVLGKTTLEILHPDDIDKAIKALNRGIIKGEGAIEARIQHKNGHYVWLDLKGNIFYDEKDELKIILTGRDVSSRKKTEKKLKDSEEKLRSFMNSATDAFFIWDSDLNLIDVSDIGMMDYFPHYTTKESIIGKNLIDIVPNIEGSEIYEDVRDIINTGEPVSLEHSFDSPTIGKRYISVKAFKVGEGLGMLVSDSTNQKLADEKLKESERKYKQLFETSPYAIFLLSLDGTFLDCNPATEFLFGYTKQDILNRKFREIIGYPKEDLPGMMERFRNVVMGKKSEPFERQVYKKDGTLIWILTHLNVVQLGSDYLVQAIVFDITENKLAEELIKQEIVRLQELDQIRNDLVRRISHELKTPLISIFSTSQHLIENYKDDLSEKILKLISTIHKGGKRLKLLSDNLINSLRLEASGIKLNFQNQDLIKIIDESIENFEIFINERNILIKKETPDVLYFNIDEIWISQVFSNLLSNAIKNTPKMGAIYIKVLEEKDNIDIMVSDTGVGLTEKEKEKLFTRFGKIERFNEDLDIISEGSGLGLYISREIIQLHDGEILVESKGRNNGSIFTIRLSKYDDKQ